MGSYRLAVINEIAVCAESLKRLYRTILSFNPIEKSPFLFTLDLSLFVLMPLFGILRIPMLDTVEYANKQTARFALVSR